MSHFHLATKITVSDHSKVDKENPIHQCLYPLRGDKFDMEVLFVFAMDKDHIPMDKNTSIDYLLTDFKSNGKRAKVLCPIPEGIVPIPIVDNLVKIEVADKKNGIVKPGLSGCSPFTYINNHQEEDKIPYAIEEDGQYFLPMFCFPDCENPFTSSYFAFCECDGVKYNSFKNKVSNTTQWEHRTDPTNNRGRTAHDHEFDII